MFRKVIMLTAIRFRQEFSCVRVYMGYLLGFSIAFFYGWSYVRYAGGAPVGTGDAFLLLTNQFLQLSFVLLGYFIIISNLPMVNSLTLLTLIRSGRKNWVYSIFLYLIGQTFLYYIVVFTGALIPAIGTVGWNEEWSKTMLYLTRFRPMQALEEYGITPLGDGILELWTPTQAALHSMLLIVCYSLFLAFIIFAGNLNTSTPRGNFFAVIVHFIGTIMLKMGGKYLHMVSPLGNAVLGMRIDEKGKSCLEYSYLLFGGCLIGLMMIIVWLSNSADFMQCNSDRTW